MTRPDPVAEFEPGSVDEWLAEMLEMAVTEQAVDHAHELVSEYEDEIEFLKGLEALEADGHHVNPQLTAELATDQDITTARFKELQDESAKVVGLSIPPNLDSIEEELEHLRNEVGLGETAVRQMRLTAARNGSESVREEILSSE